MPKCPECKVRIKYLHNYHQVNRSAILDNYGKMIYGKNIINKESETYECPECSEILFNNHEMAEKFLRGETNG